MKLSANAVRLAYAFAATADIRYYLNGVHVEPHPSGGAAITGCDGHRLLQVHDSCATDVEEMIISLDKATRAALKSDRMLQTEFEPSRIAVINSNGVPVHLQPTGYKVEGKFPDVHAVLGERESWEQGIRGTFNVAYIAEATKAASDAISGNGAYRGFTGVTFYSKAAESPAIPQNQKLLFIVEGITPAWGVVMGMRGDSTDPAKVAFPERKAA